MTIGVGIEAGLLEGVHHKLDQTQSTLNRMIEDYREQQSEAIMLDLSQAFQLNASGFGIVSLTGPPASYYWVVRALILSDSQLWTNTMGGANAQWGKGQLPLTPGTQMPAVQVRWAFGTCPNAADFGTNHFNLKHGDLLIAQVNGGNANQILQATAYVEQWSIFSRTEYGAGPEAHS